jgi:mono/diheme cytochrome c family protein
MKKTTYGYAVAVAIAALSAVACDNALASNGTNEAVVKRGEYLVTVGGCNDCHTPLKMGPNGPEPDMSRMLSGHPEQLKITEPPAPGQGPWMLSSAATNTAHAGPWGVSFTANLTPDTNTGIGIWTEEIFIKTLRTGRHWGTSRPILPPMPWFNYGKMTDEDLKAVYAYLRTIKPITNHVPDPLPPAVVPTATER